MYQGEGMEVIDTKDLNSLVEVTSILAKLSSGFNLVLFCH